MPSIIREILRIPQPRTSQDRPVDNGSRGSDMYAHPCQQVDLAWNGVVSPVTIKDWESDKVIPTVESETQVLRAFEEAGVEFLNGSSPGVMRRAVVVQPNQLETKVTYRKNPRGSQAIVLSP